MNKGWRRIERYRGCGKGMGRTEEGESRKKNEGESEKENEQG